MLKSIPGFSVIRKGGADGDPVFRGMSGSRLGILLDGQEIHGGCGGRMDPPTAYIYPESYDRVTVLKGPQQVLYVPGSSAGVVLFERESKRMTEPGWSAQGSLTFGSFGRNDQYLEARGGNPDFYARANATRSDIGRGIRALLAYPGCRVAMPPQTCCGLPALGNGDIDMARRYAQKNAQRLVEYIDKGYSVLYACTSCGLTLVHDYPEVFEIPEGRKIAENTYNLHEFILEAIEDGSISMDFGEVNRRIAYHIPCHLRALGIGYPAARLFEKIPGLTFEILEDDCCGLAGSYGFKKKNQQTSVNLGVIAAAAITSLPVDAFASDCGACKMQLGHFTGLPAFDPSEIVIESLANRSKKKAVRKRRMP